MERAAAADSDSALDAISARRPSLVLLDVWLQGSRLDGLELLDEIKRRDSSIPVLMISGHGNLDTAVAAIRRGAADFIEKPFEAERLLLMVARATETERLRREIASLRATVGRDDDLTGSSAAINGVRATLKRVASTGSRVLVMGGAGVGKEVAARLLHGWSQRANAPFVIVSAARMTPERVEEELFGVEEGGDLVRSGLLEQAHGGTLFLDEIADMPIATQARILRVLTDQSFTRVGGQRVVKVDVRVVSATARDLTHEIAEGRFREDLYYRLNVVPVLIPAPGRTARGYSGARRCISWRTTPPSVACRRPRSRPTRWSRCSPMNGPAMSASCATSSSARSSWRRATGSGGSISTCCPPKCSAIRARWAAAPTRSWDRRCARRARRSSANICASRSAASRAIFRAPRALSGWSARRCTAN